MTDARPRSRPDSVSRSDTSRSTEPVTASGRPDERGTVSRRALLGSVVALAIVVVVTLVAGAVRFDRAIDRRVDALLATRSEAPTRVMYSRDDLEGVPAPIRRYLDHVLTEGQPLVQTARIDQRGSFRLGDASSPWKPLEATQMYTTDPPGFVWDAHVQVAPLVPVRVVDSYVDGAGSLEARLLSTIPVANATPTPELDAGELSRYLAEAVWFPTALLPRQGVEWDPVDDHSARATLEHDGTTVSLVFHVDENDEVDLVSTDERPRAVDGGFELSRWSGAFRDYQERGGMRVPTAAAVRWELPDGDLPYWRARLDDFDYRPRA